jgi:hypothetical protein
MVACALLAPATSSATSTKKQLKAATTRGTAYLRAQQQTDGSFSGFGAEWTSRPDPQHASTPLPLPGHGSTDRDLPIAPPAGLSSAQQPSVQPRT